MTTLFVLVSLGGTISTGAVDDRNVDLDPRTVPGVGEGLGQGHRLQEARGPWSPTSGRVLATVGRNETKAEVTGLPVAFVVVVVEHHLTEVGVGHLQRRGEWLVVATSDPQHPSIAADDPRLLTLRTERRTDVPRLFGALDTLTLLDGAAAELETDLDLLRPLDLLDVRRLDHSCLRLRSTTAPREAS